MKRITAAFCLAVILTLLISAPVLAQDYPAPVGYVSDYGDLLSLSTVAYLEDKLTVLEKDTSAEVAVVILDNLAGYSLEEYAVGLFESWGIGQKDKDNGLLLILALEEEEIRIEVGYGLEELITDGRAGRILDDEIVPYLDNGDYDLAFENGVAAIEAYIRDGIPPSVVEENPVQNILSAYQYPFYTLIILGFLTIYMIGFMARTSGIWLGGIWGIIVGLVLGFGFGSLPWTWALPLGLGFGGLILDGILSSNYRSRSSSGMSTGWFSSGGGFRGSGGGFGGFGGGRSGGGGASRKW